MGAPRKLKNFMLFNDGNAYLGDVATVTLPTLTRKTEEWRGGGMSGPVLIDQGQEAITLEWTCGGPMRGVLAQYGVTTADGVQLRFAGAYQSDSTGAVDAIEVVVRGRHTEIGFGDAQAGEDTEFSVTTACSYYKLSWNGATVIEIDLLNMVENVGGSDRLAAVREAIGL